MKTTRLSRALRLIRRSSYFTSVALLMGSIATALAPASSLAATTAATGLYNGPGAVTAHNNFEAWLGSPVPYTTDYVAYTNGWSADFNPDQWLTQPWGTWVKAQPGRRLVLGLPMLENSNYGQFDQGASGAFDPYFTRLANAMVANGIGNSIIRLGYEANCDTIGPWQATDNPAGYVADFRHIVQLMRATPGSNFQFDWTVCSGWQSNHVLSSFADFYPGDDVVDIMGIDQYDVKWQDTTVTAAQRWSYNVSRYMGLQDQKNFAASHNKPVSFPEWGLYKAGDNFAGGGDDPYFIDQMADWIAASNTVYQSYFNLNWGGGVLSDFPLGQAEYKLRFGATTSTSTTTTTTTTPPATADTTAPSVGFVSPINATVSGITTLQTQASDNVGVSHVDYYVDGTLVNSSSVAPYSYSWNTTSVPNGSHSLVAKAYDAAGNVGSATMAIMVSNSTATPPPAATTAPKASIVSPSSGSSVGAKVSISAKATDNVGVSRIDVYVNGVLKQSFSGSSAKYGWSSKTMTTDTVTFKAYDAAGNVGSASLKLVPVIPGTYSVSYL